jgi:hypothetical protein
MTISTNGDATARDNWARYQYGKDRGHLVYLEQAKLSEGMYLGAGEQWSEQDKHLLQQQGRPAYEFNEIMPSVNSAIGYQIHNRLDIAFKPRGGDADLQTATLLSKVTMQVADMCQLRWLETQVFTDGLVQQRGYFDLRIDFDSNMHGDIRLGTLDPMDVIPDPDSKTYDPDGWADVVITRWLTLDEIQQLYGKAAKTKAEASGDDGPDFGDLDDEEERAKFGGKNQPGLYDAFGTAEDGLRRYRVIDRQRWVYELTHCMVWPDTGDVQVEDAMAEDSIADALLQGAVRSKRMRKRIQWAVSTYSTTLFDKYSPYEHFTVVPFFAYFRRGKTRSMVDNAIGPQKVLNKAVSQFVHILNTSANSGWITDQNSITNMDADELEQRGAQTGLHIEVKEGARRPEKIQPNTVPSGIDRLIDRATQTLKDVTVPEAMRGNQGAEVSGIAIQAKQFASQQQLAVPLDNLAMTRRLLALRILKLIQTYYDSARVFRITETDPMTGKQVEERLEINQFDQATGRYLNDVTVGTYDVVITEQPMQVTFMNSQFQQALEMREKGVRIPDATVVQYSNLSNKAEILHGMQSAQAPTDPTLQAKAALLAAQTRKADADTTARSMETQYSALQTAQVIAQTPQTAPLADKLLRSGGYVDQDAAPIVPNAPAGLPSVDVPANTHPLTPANPAVGMHAGIETAAADGVQ